MSTLKRFYRNVLQNPCSYAAGVDGDRIHTWELESHLATISYNGFTLTDAVRPSLDLAIVPQQGYKYERLAEHRRDYSASRRCKTILAVSVSLDPLFETFLELLDPLGETVHVLLETSHGFSETYRTTFRREEIDLPILKSFLYDHEGLLLNDGCTGISVFSSQTSACVRFDDHKLIFVDARSLSPFETILRRRSIEQNETMRLLTDAEHIHITRDEYIQRFKILRTTLGIDERYTAAR